MGKLSLLQVVGLEILAMFSQVCGQEGLRWFAMLGTLLGTIRHAGFIPWDEDIDVAMPRADYDRLRKRPQIFSYPYFLQTPHNDPAAVPRFMRLRRSDTTVISKVDGLTRGGNMGAYIDILPLDDVPDVNAARCLRAAAMRVQKQMLATAALDENSGHNLPEWKAAFCYSYGGIEGSYPLLADRYEWLCSMYDGQPYNSIPVLGGARGCRVFDKKWFSASKAMPFEDMRLPVPSGWKEVLVACYPDGLLAFDPSKGGKESRTAMIVDMGSPYTKHLSRYTDMLRYIESKRIFLFGAGDSLRIWLERYSRGLDVICAFDNDSAKWSTQSYGLTVRPPHEMRTLLDGNSRLIIASIWHKEIAAQLDEMNVHDYYVFLDGLSYERNTICNAK